MKRIRIFKIICLVIAVIAEVILFIPETSEVEFLGEITHSLIDYDIGFITMLLVIPYFVFEALSFSKTRFERKTCTILAKSFLLAYAFLMLLTSIKEAGNFGSAIGALGFTMCVILFVFAGVSFAIDLKYLRKGQND